MACGVTSTYSSSWMYSSASSSVKIFGGTITAYNCGAVRVEADSTFRMSGGVIENFEMSGSTRVKGTVSVTSGGRFEMSGGVIRNNENFSSAICQGGGVLLCGWNKDQPYAVMTLSGDAVIEGNFSREGGGIYVVGNAELTMTGGTIGGSETDTYAGKNKSRSRESVLKKLTAVCFVLMMVLAVVFFLIKR